MNNNVAQTLARLTEILQKASSGAVVLPNNPTLDAVAAAISLYLGLTKMGKSLTLACSTKVKHNLIASDKIQSQLSTSGDNLVVSFPYTDGAVDKVDYNIQADNFNLIIAPRQGYPKLDPKQVKFNYTGGNLDFIIVIDAPTLNTIGDLYIQNEKQFQGKDIINIDRHLTNSFYGSVNYVNKTSSSISEMILKLLQNLGVEIDRDMATNLYAGIAASTNNFTSYSVTADTFENIATLLRLGAVKKPMARQPQPLGFQPARQQVVSPLRPKPMPTQSIRGQIEAQPDMMTPIEEVEKEPKGAQTSTPQDWLKPKIFRGGGGGLV